MQTFHFVLLDVNNDKIETRVASSQNELYKHLKLLVLDDTQKKNAHWRAHVRNGSILQPLDYMFSGQFSSECNDVANYWWDQLTEMFHAEFRND